jgi:hypothetical protein
MIQVRAGQTQSSFLSCQHDPCVAAQVLLALVTFRFVRGDEHLQFFVVGPMLIHTVYSADAWDGFQAKRLGKTSHSWTTFRLPRQGIEKGDGSVWTAGSTPHRLDSRGPPPCHPPIDTGPPMSPLTHSYFTTWAFFDFRFGAGRTTAGWDPSAGSHTRARRTSSGPRARSVAVSYRARFLGVFGGETWR